MATLNDWDVVDANNNAAPPAGWPENTMQYSEVNDTGRAVQGTLKRYFADVNGSLSAGGVADAYTVNLNESGYTAYFTGMYFACQINTTNTGASTIDVNSIGVQNIVNDDGSALAAGTLEAGGIYEFRYDGTDFQVTGVTAGQSVSVGQAIFSNSNDPDLVDTDVAINAGASDPDTAQHIEIGPSDIQSKSDATTAAELALNELGGNVNLGAQSGSGIVTLYADGETSLVSNTAGIFLNGSVATATPPTTEAVTTRIIMYDQDGSDELMFFGFPATQNIQLTNRMHGGDVSIRAEDAGGTERLMFNGDPDGGASLYFTGATKLLTQAPSVVLYGSVTSSTPPVQADPVDTYIQLFDTSANRLSYYGHSGNGNLQIANEVHGGEVTITGQDAGGVARLMYLGRPAADQLLYYNGGLACATLPAASGGLQVNNTLTGGGLERVLTTSDIGAGAPFRGAMAYHNTTQVIGASTLAAVAFNAESYDTDAIHDNITNNTRLTVPSGVTRVRLSGGVYRGSGGPLEGSLSINKNGGSSYIGYPESQIGPGSSGQRDDGHSVHSGVLAVVATDYFELLFDNSDTASATLSPNRTWFAMEILE